VFVFVFLESCERFCHWSLFANTCNELSNYHRLYLTDNIKHVISATAKLKIGAKAWQTSPRTWCKYADSFPQITRHNDCRVKRISVSQTRLG